MFLATLVIFNVFSRLDFRAGVFIIFIILLAALLKKTRFLFYMFMMSLPFTSNSFSFRMGFFLKLNYLLFALLAISFFYNKLRSKDYSFVITPIDAPLFAFLTVTAISIFQTRFVSKTPIIIYDIFRNYPWIKGFVGVMFLIFMYMVYYVAINILSEKGMFRRVFFLVLIMSMALSLWGIIGFTYAWITSSHLPGYADPLIAVGWDLRVKTTFEEPLFFGNFLMLIIPVVYCLIISKTRYLNERFMKAAALVLTAALFFTQSTSAWLAYSVFIFLFVIFYWQHSFKGLSKMLLKTITGKRFLRVIMIAILSVIGVLMISSIFFGGAVNKKADKLMDSIFENAINAFNPFGEKFWSTKTRFLAMQYAWEGFKKHPLLGIGYSNFLFYSGYEVYEGLFLEAVNLPEVNNYPIKVLAETGIVGFMIFAWLVFKIMKSILSRMTNEKGLEKKALLTGYLFSFIALGVQLLFFSYITGLYLWFMIAMMISLCKTKSIKILEDRKG